MSKKSIKQWTKDNKNSLFVGLIGSLIWQIFNFGFELIPYAGFNVLKSLENMIYFKSSTMSSDYMLILFSSMLLGFFIGAGTYTIFEFIFKKIVSVFKNGKKETSLVDVPRHHFKVISNTSAVLSIILSIIFLINIISFNLKIAYDLDMTSIRPYISNKDFNKLGSDWAQMKSKEDYEKIYEIIGEVQDKYQLSSAKRKLNW